MHSNLGFILCFISFNLKIKIKINNRSNPLL